MQGDLTEADGRAERRAALDMIHRHSPGSTRRLTLGAGKGYDAAGLVAGLRRACAGLVADLHRACATRMLRETSATFSGRRPHHPA